MMYNWLDFRFRQREKRVCIWYRKTFTGTDAAIKLNNNHNYSFYIITLQYEN